MTQSIGLYSTKFSASYLLHRLVIIKSLEINFVSKGKKGMACGCMKDGENDSLPDKVMMLKFNTIVIELYIRRGEKECLYQSQISGSAYVESTTTPSLIFRLFGPIEIFRTHANSISIQHEKTIEKKTTFSPTKREKSETKHNIRPSVASFIIFCFFFSSTLLFCYSFALLPRQYIYLYSMKSHANGWDFSYRLNSSAFLHSESSST